MKGAIQLEAILEVFFREREGDWFVRCLCASEEMNQFTLTPALYLPSNRIGRQMGVIQRKRKTGIELLLMMIH